MRLPITGFLLCCALHHSQLLACDPWAARVVAVNGLVVMQAAGGSQAPNATGQDPTSPSDARQPVTVDTIICPGQRVMTGANSRAALYLSNNSFLRLDQNSILILPEQTRSDSFWINLQQGVSHFISRITRRFEIETSFVNAAVEGTEFLVTANTTGASISVIEGQVTATGPRSSLTETVTAGQKLIAEDRQSPYRVISIDKSQTVDWAIYYPPLFTLGQLEDKGQQRWLDAAAAQLQRSRPDLALAELGKADQGNAAVRAASAAVLLSVGQVQRAEALLQGLQSATALALQSIIYSASNRGEEALAAARQALAVDSRSHAALLALSYAHQTRLDLRAALAAALQAKSVQPNSALAWSRVSELQLALGDLRQARSSATRAVELDATDPRAMTQLAFLNLFSLKFAAAEEQLHRAIRLDSENPQAHLALGLALLRQGELAKGRRQLEIATSLDPARSVLRSYLGRAYFEEKRDTEAAVQWQLAKEFDPQDPTPWFYQGVRKLFINDPVGAIEELQVSRRLNDERQLYRAETLLQSDAASRSATLARAYTEVGFDESVLLAAWDALKQDPANAEGHRLLADTYLGNNRLEAARISELQQAQLLQPLSAYPLQPLLTQSNLAIIEGLGPSRPGLNEYHALFNQDGLNLLVGGLAGGDGTLADEIVLSGLRGPVSLSLGQYHYETDGFRESAYQEQDIYNALLQWQATPMAKFELEVRDLTLDRGDLGLSVISQAIERSQTLKTYRLGSYLQFSANHGLVVSAISQEREDREQTLFPGAAITSTNDEDPWIVELKYLGKSERLQWQLGAGQYSAREKQQLAITISPEFEPVTNILPPFEQRKTHRNYYLYLDAAVSTQLHLEAGLAYDDLEQSADTDASQWSPKIGLAWKDDNWRLRAMAFRSFKRDLAASQTIEKTYVAGFNQIYSDLNAADSKNYALAVDFLPSRAIHTGLEFLHRDVKFPSFDSDTGETRQLDYFQEFGNIYLAALITPRASLRLSYEYNDNDFDYKLDLGGGPTFEIVRSKTHTVPLTLRQFLNRYFSLSFTSRYVSQTNTLTLLDFATLKPYVAEKKEEAWLFDLTLEARLPERLGVVELGVKNLFDRNVEILDESAELLRFYPGQFVYARVQLHF